MPPKVEDHEREAAQADLEKRMKHGRISVGATVREIRQRFVGLLYPTDWGGLDRPLLL